MKDSRSIVERVRGRMETAASLRPTNPASVEAFRSYAEGCLRYYQENESSRPFVVMGYNGPTVKQADAIHIMSTLGATMGRSGKTLTAFTKGDLTVHVKCLANGSVASISCPRN